MITCKYLNHFYNVEYIERKQISRQQFEFPKVKFFLRLFKDTISLKFLNFSSDKKSQKKYIEVIHSLRRARKFIAPL